MDKNDFTFSADANGYMIHYKGKPIGGAGVQLPRDKPMRGMEKQNNSKGNAESSKREIEALVSGGGQKRFRDVIARIDAEEAMRFKVIDPKTDGDVFGGEMPLASLITVYPMAPVDTGNGVKQFADLDLHESTMAQTLTPSRDGHGTYKVVRVR